MEAVLAAADDYRYRAEREALRQIVGYVRRGYRGELIVQVGADGLVEVSEAPSAWRRDSRVSVVDVSDLSALHYAERAAELGIY